METKGAKKMFTRPHVRVTDAFADIIVNLGDLRKLESYDAFLSLLQAEISEVYGSSRWINTAVPIQYSVSSDAATSTFANNFNERIFSLIRHYDATKAEAIVLRQEHEDIMAARPPPVKPEPKFDENGEELPPPPKSKKALREEAELKKKDTERLRKVLESEHKAECDSIKLKNAFLLQALRVPLC